MFINRKTDKMLKETPFCFGSPLLSKSSIDTFLKMCRYKKVLEVFQSFLMTIALLKC